MYSHYTVDSVPTPSFPPHGDDPNLLTWEWALIAIGIAIVLVVVTVTGIILIRACRKSISPNGPNAKADGNDDIPMK